MQIEESGFSVEQIKNVIPHRYPFLMIDKVISVSPGKDPNSREGRTVHAVKCVTVNEPHFHGHFPQQAVMPGVLQVEAIAQAGALAYFRPNDQCAEVLIASILSAKFRRPVVPGDQLDIRCTVERARKNMIVLNGQILVDGQKATEAKVMAYLVQSKKENS